MKVENISNKEITFEPITIQITIENITDLAWLYGCANIDMNDAKKNCHSYPILKDSITQGNHGLPQMTFYDAINDIRKEVC